ncbi:hypothetical protein [Tenacibaculum retecalamus]|uniref:hypothetical protein n=1 Tax=Tenacibaculum retecalamus TaxID=3018315 RepID=UPI0023D907C6|nr:hypothetical protein [Tenacibaculum retecalamus]WBX70359.1 hypothetical protein PG912_08720 [Tenacibaculum retecalamus]
MKILKLIILLIATTQLIKAQSVDFELIKYNGLNFHSTKSDIIGKFGKPHKKYDPNYECGFLSTDSQDDEYLTLDYGKIKFTGNKQELYVLEQVDLENDSTIKIKYGNENLTCETDLAKLIEIFGDGLAKHFGNELNGAIVIFHERADDGIRLSIKNGKLIRFEYWSPC